MSTFYQTDEVASRTTIPTNAEAITKVGWGIDATLSSFIIQNASVTHSRTEDITQDQKGAQIGALDYDERWDLQLDVIGNASASSGEDADIGYPVGDTVFAWNGHKWKLTGCSYSGSFQDKKRWSLTAYRTACFPPQS